MKKIDEAFDNMSKRVSSHYINDVLYRVFTNGKIIHGCILLVYSLTAYCTIQHGYETEDISRIFDNFYLNTLKPWSLKQGVWTCVTPIELQEICFNPLLRQNTQFDERFANKVRKY